MRPRLFLMLCLMSLPGNVRAEYCSKSPDIAPCTPDPGPETDRAKQKIFDYINKGRGKEAIVRAARANYMAIRADPNADLQARHTAAQRYYYEKMGQEAMYKVALNLTQELYRVKPQNAETFQIGRPSEQAMSYMAGLYATWGPEMTDSGPGVKLAIKVTGSDGRDYFSGAVSLNPDQPGNFLALTLEDGRVLILKDTFHRALERNNPGYLARVIHHESKHFDRLSHGSTDASGLRKSWASPEEEESSAYRMDLEVADTFGLTSRDLEEIRQWRRRYREAVLRGHLTRRAPSPQERSKWENYYKTQQVNITRRVSGSREGGPGGEGPPAGPTTARSRGPRRPRTRRAPRRRARHRGAMRLQA